ncbi:MAG: glycosyltransferase [Pirellulaceae bacterium]
MSRICLVCVSLRAGGTERVVSMLANHFVGRHQVDVILLSPKEPFYELNPRVGLWQFSGKQRGLRQALYYPRAAGFIRRIVKERRPDVVLSFGEFISPSVRIITAGLGARVFVFNRGSPFRSRSLSDRRDVGESCIGYRGSDLTWYAGESDPRGWMVELLHKKLHGSQL